MLTRCLSGPGAASDTDMPAHPERVRPSDEFPSDIQVADAAQARQGRVWITRAVLAWLWLGVIVWAVVCIAVLKQWLVDGLSPDIPDTIKGLMAALGGGSFASGLYYWKVLMWYFPERRR